MYANKNLMSLIKGKKMSQLRRTQKERKEETSLRLIEETIQCLLELGYSGTNVKEICARAGVTTGAIQHNFNSKQGLMIAVVKKLFRGLDEGVKQIGPHKASLNERIENLFEHYWNVYNDDQYYAVCEVLLAVRRDSELLRLNNQIRTEWLQEMKSYLISEYPDVDIPIENKIGAVLDMIDFLRGFCIRRIYGLSDETIKRVKIRARAIITDAFKASPSN
jgi:AcrR family transcriptional regulator